MSGETQTSIHQAQLSAIEKLIEYHSTSDNFTESIRLKSLYMLIDTFLMGVVPMKLKRLRSPWEHMRRVFFTFPEDRVSRHGLVQVCQQWHPHGVRHVKVCLTHTADLDCL